MSVMGTSGYRFECPADEALWRGLWRCRFERDYYFEAVGGSDDPAVMRAFLAQLNMDDPEDRNLAFALVLATLRTRQGQRPWMRVWCPPVWPLAVLLVMMANALVSIPETGMAADRRPADCLTPALPVLLARSVLTAAPPARVLCPAGMTG